MGGLHWRDWPALCFERIIPNTHVFTADVHGKAYCSVKRLLSFEHRTLKLLEYFCNSTKWTHQRIELQALLPHVSTGYVALHDVRQQRARTRPIIMQACKVQPSEPSYLPGFEHIARTLRFPKCRVLPDCVHHQQSFCQPICKWIYYIGRPLSQLISIYAGTCLVLSTHKHL